MLLKKLGLLLGALLFSLLVAEVLLRLLHAAPEVHVTERGRFRLSANPKIGFEPAPLDYHGQERSFLDYEGASNSLGFRDGEHAVRKPPGVYRVVVIGDSVGVGLKVDRTADTFAPILQGLLQSRGVNAEVINLSVSGYNTQQEVELFRERGLQYEPDLVLVAYTLGDRERLDGGIMESLLRQESAQGGRRALGAYRFLLHSALYRFFEFRVLAAHPQAPAPTGAAGTPAPATAPPSPDVPAEGATPAEVQKYLDLVSGDTVAEYFGVLRGLSEAQHFEVLVTVFPYFVKNFGHYKHIDQHTFARGVAERNHFHLLDLLEPMVRCRKDSPEPINVDNYHPNPRGHRCAAEAMAAVILGEIHPPAAPGR